MAAGRFVSDPPDLAAADLRATPGRALGATPFAGYPPGPGREISDEEREGVSSTDIDATSALGVGESINRHGEDVAKQEVEPGREDTGTRGASGRPAGVSDERDSSSVDPR
jgi:hypothetical protein